jgi:hypothetical protein
VTNLSSVDANVDVDVDVDADADANADADAVARRKLFDQGLLLYKVSVFLTRLERLHLSKGGLPP